MMARLAVDLGNKKAVGFRALVDHVF